MVTRGDLEVGINHLKAEVEAEAEAEARADQAGPTVHSGNLLTFCDVTICFIVSDVCNCLQLVTSITNFFYIV
jgi:hypothetical protein